VSEHALEMVGMSKEFPGVRALDNVTLRVRSGSVHALMGENGAGKSTLMKCLFGMYQPDEGEIRLGGEKVSIASPKEALSHGISMIHQEMHPIPDRNVMENLWLGRLPTHGMGPLQFVDHRKMRQDSLALFKELGLDLDPEALVGSLSVSKIQALEIAKAVSYQARIIVMDEPTSSITGQDVENLFAIIKQLTQRGVAVVYISHKMEEILRIADEVTVMRDGCLVGSWPAKELTMDTLIARMVGRPQTERFPPKHNVPGDILLSVKNLSARESRGIKQVSFDLRHGEILGIGGLVGSQRTELIETLFGLRSHAAGTVEISGKKMTIRSPQDAIRAGLALLTEERRATGVFPELSVLENTVISSQRRFVGPTHLLREKERVRETEKVVHDLRVKTASIATPIKNLSGGNQQKVLFGRWLLTGPEILLLDEPTRGIDVGAKHEIYNLIFGLACQGKGVIVISSEMPELLGLSDRIMVMCEGRLSGILDRSEATEEEILRLATQFAS
jgi:methyl-galactoside transport system ATP-binding protein